MSFNTRLFITGLVGFFFAVHTSAASADEPTSMESAEVPAETPTESTLLDKEVELIAREGLQLAEFTVARGIEEKKPIDPRTAYKLGEFEKIAAYMIVINPSETADEIHISFRNVETGKERGKISVSVGAQKKWRTWAYTRTIRTTGKWEILVRDKDEQLLGRAPFEILPAE